MPYHSHGNRGQSHIAVTTGRVSSVRACRPGRSLVQDEEVTEMTVSSVLFHGAPLSGITELQLRGKKYSMEYHHNGITM